MDLRDLQSAVDAFVSEHGLAHSAETGLLDLTAEVGELSKAVLRSTQYGETETEYTDEIGSELGDAFYSLLALANAYDVDLEQALEQSFEKYRRRLANGGMGSEFDE